MYHAICSDRGTVKKINQDSALYKQASTGNGDLMLAAVCDGMGGLRNGEVASGEMIKALAAWFDNYLPLLVKGGITDEVLVESLNRLITDEDERITEYGEENGECGTTLSAVIACGSRYLCVNIGDSRVYRITDPEGSPGNRQKYIRTGTSSCSASVPEGTWSRNTAWENTIKETYSSYAVTVSGIGWRKRR